MARRIARRNGGGDPRQLGFQRWDAGAGVRDQTSIFVSRGVGTIYVPYRFNCPPDVSILTLTRRV